ISSRVEAFERADLQVKVVDIESYALERTLPFLSPEASTADADRPLIKGILDIGALLTRLYVFEGEKLVFMREEEFGGNQLWLAAATQYEKTQEEILELLRTNALPADYTEAVLTPFVATTAMQVKRLMDFFYSSSHYDETPEIYLSGGPCALPGLIPLIKEQSNIQMQLANPFAHIKTTANIDREALMKCAPEFLTAFGLALR
ncbi:MAG: pilus assembly protein PilM, partial [Methylococcales bacterium]|nr:pilus assembly protein PilM [Methylococcales bacterium]